MSHALKSLIGALAAAALCLSAGVACANADERLRIHSLSVVGGEGLWHAENEFRLSWDPVAPATLAEISSTDYVVRDAAGMALGPPVRTGAAASELRQVHIPPTSGPGRVEPGRYTVEVWFEGKEGDGPHAGATLRFDNARPPSARALGPAGWIRAGREAVVDIEHPAAPLPASGIRGYAVVLDHGTGALPCAGPDSCTEAETDLRSGIDGDSISLGPLFEGTNVVVVLAVSNSGLRSELPGRTALHVDGSEPRVALQGAPQGWTNHPAQLTAVAVDSQSGTAAAGPGGPRTSIAIDGAPPVEALGGSVTATVWGDGNHRVTYFGRDAVGNSGETHPDSATIRIDETAPRVYFARAQDPSEPERIEATVADALSGAGTTGSIAVRPTGSTAQFTPIPTAVAAGRLTALWDSDAFPTGSYEFRATGFDAAGNSAGTTRRTDGTRMVLANPLKRPTQIEFGIGGRKMVWHRCKRGRGGVHCRREEIASFERRPASRSIPYGRGTPVGGRLLSSSGAPLPGQTVTVVESFAPGATIPQRTTTVQTAPDGTFLAHLGAGPSRSVEVSFAGTRLLTHASSRDIQLAVATAIRLRASVARATIGGAPVVFSGQIAGDGGRIPAEGRPVELQFRVGDTPWSEFRTVQTDSRGRFRYPYAFSDDDSRGVRFQFRAYAPAQPGWPYEPGFSRPVAVTGR